MTTTTPILDREKQIKALWTSVTKFVVSLNTSVIFAAWIVLFLLVWYNIPDSYIPGPLDVLAAFPNVWFNQGIAYELFTSLALCWSAVSIMFVLSLLIAYSTAFPKPWGNIFTPFATLISSGRFNGFVGMPLVFFSFLHDAHRTQVALLVYGVGVFTVMSVVKMIQQIPKAVYDHSRTLRMGEWRVFWEVVVLGSFDQVLDIMRINIAMGWMMLPMVESRYIFEGGVGALMEKNAKVFDNAGVFCILFIILGTGLLQDWSIGFFKRILCPYASIGLERGN